MQNQKQTTQFSLQQITGIAEIPEKVMVTGFADASDPFIPKRDANYVFNKEVVRDLNAFISRPEGDGLYITGPTGSGKTSVVTQFASRLNWPVQQVTAHGRMELADLVGFHALISPTPGATPVMKFMYGPLARAMREGHILLINEIDLADPAEMAGLNDILEGRPLVIAQNGGEIINPHPMFRIVVTGNSAGAGDASGLYQGVQMQNLASMDRYRLMKVDYTTPDVELTILHKAVPTLPEQIKKGMIRVANEVRGLFVGNDNNDSQLSITLSTRALIRWAKLTMMYRGAPNAMALALNQTLLIRTASEEREAVLRIAKDIFGDVWV